MNDDQQFDIAVAAFAKLEKLHAEFMQHIAQISGEQLDGGLIVIKDNEISAECLGAKLRAVHRPVVREGHLAAVEYPFTVRHREGDLVVWTMYLEPDGDLYGDQKRQDRVTGSANIYAAKYIIKRLALMLLRSPVFAPTQ